MVSSIYTHPIEFIMGNLFPLFFSFFILKDRMHIVTFMSWNILRLIETKDAHAGFDIPFSMFKLIPFGTGSPYHNFHHLKNIGNYGTFTRIWDTIFGTNKVYLESVLQHQKKE